MTAAQLNEFLTSMGEHVVLVHAILGIRRQRKVMAEAFFTIHKAGRAALTKA